MVRGVSPSSKSECNDSLVKEMSNAYAQIVFNIAQSWVRYSNGNSDLFDCNYESEIEVPGKNGVKIFFYLLKKKELYDSKNCWAYIYIPKEVKISDETLDGFYRNIKLINNLLMKDYHSHVKLAGNCFYREMSGRVTPKKLLCYYSPLTRERPNVWLIKFTPPSMEADGGQGVWGRWYPLNVFSYFSGKKFSYPETLNSYDEIPPKFRTKHLWDENGEPIEDSDDEKTQYWKFICREGFEHILFLKEGGGYPVH